MKNLPDEIIKDEEVATLLSLNATNLHGVNWAVDTAPTAEFASLSVPSEPLMIRRMNHP